MGRIRTIKPEYFRHLEIFEAEEETGLPLRVAYAALWTVADREGRFKWIPRQLKIDCLPYDDVCFSRVLHALATRGFIQKYVQNGKEYGLIPTFKDHQVINNREAESKIPKPNDFSDLTREPRVDDACTTRAVRKGREGKGKELNKTLCPADAERGKIDQPDPPPVQEKIPKPDPVTENAKSAIDHLNGLTHRNFRHSKASLKNAKARLSEGFSLGNLKLVVEHKCIEWGKDPRMRNYLRPQTLFSEKFESYLQTAIEWRNVGRPHNVISFGGRIHQHQKLSAVEQNSLQCAQLAEQFEREAAELERQESQGQCAGYAIMGENG